VDTNLGQFITLRERLDVLFQKTNRNRDQLVTFLNLKSNGTISNWLNNDELPRHRIEKIAQFFAINAPILDCKDRKTFLGFLQELGPTLGRRWEAFMSLAISDSTKFGLVRFDGPIAERTVEDPAWLKAPDRMREVHVSESVRFRIPRVLFQGLPVSRAHHACIMAKDRLGWSLLSPDLVRDDFVPEYWHRAQSLYLELPTRRGGLRFRRNGLVEAYALVTGKAIPIEFLQQMAEAQNFLAAAERVVRWIEASDMRYSLFRHEFLCFHGRTPLSQLPS
jgi:hypothetical protein